MNALLSIIVLLASAFASSAARAGLATSFQKSGHLGLEIAAVAGGQRVVSSGTLTLSRLPADATVVRATLYTNQVNNGAGLDALFAGTYLGSVAPAAYDGASLDYYAYEWDVTGRVVPGVNSYSFTIGQGTVGGTNISGVALAVVWQHPNEPTRVVTIVDGIQQVGEEGPETESAAFTGLGAGETTLWIFTVLDDRINTGEVVAYNDQPVGGPIDQNLGIIASLLRIDTTSVNGTNTVSITTNTDHMGWLIAATSVSAPPVGVSPLTWQRVKQLFR